MSNVFVFKHILFLSRF